MTDEKVQEDKPAVTFKDENAAAVTDKTEPKTDELKVQEDKPAMTTKLSNDPPKDDKSMLVSEEKIEQATATTTSQPLQQNLVMIHQQMTNRYLKIAKINQNL